MTRAKSIPFTKEDLWDIFDYREGVLYWKKSRYKTLVGKPAGSIDGNGYLQVNINKNRYATHRLVWAMLIGNPPNKIDHKDTNKLNNKIDNLREAKHSENCLNKKIRSDSCSGVKNVGWNRQKEKWRVRLRKNGMQSSFGYYEDLELAELVAIEARNKYHGDFANHGGGYIPEVTHPFK